MEYTLADIVAKLGGKVVGVKGSAEIKVNRLSSLKQAQVGEISFLSDTKHTQALTATQASAVVLRQEHRSLTDLPCIVVEDPYVYFAKLSALFNPIADVTIGIHHSAIIASSAVVAGDVTLEAGVVIADGAKIGERVRIGAGCVVENNAQIGDDTVLESGVVVKYGVIIGQRCHLFSGSVLGSDGFGYAEKRGRWVKIPQVGGLRIGDDVDIGANTTIDRGALDDTVIENGVKIDNLVQIAHNCQIGEHTVIAGCVGIAGSAVIGKRCRIGGAAMILGHLNIADGVTISPGSMITRSIVKTGTYTALMPFQTHQDWLKTAANLRHLGKVANKVKQLEKIIKQLQNKIID